MGGETSGPVIELNLSQTRLVSRLRLKLAEYQARLDAGPGPYEAPEQTSERLRGTRYRHRILGTLLEEGRVDTWELSLEVSDEEGEFSVESWNNSCGVIEDYVANEGANNTGSGLPAPE